METKSYFAVGIGFVLVILIYLSMRSNSGSVSVQPAFEVVGGVSPEIASLRTTEKVAEINSRENMFESYLGYLLGMEGGYRSENIARIESNAQVNISRYETEAATTISKIVAEAQKYGFDAQVNISNRESQADETAARYNYEATRQQEKTKRHNTGWGAIGSIAKGILSIFGF